MFGQFRPREFIPENELIAKMNIMACSANVVSKFLCANSLFLICGYNKSLDLTLVPTIAGHFPAGGSSKQFDHFGQVFNTGKEK